jgi:WD40 repeat protein
LALSIDKELLSITTEGSVVTRNLTTNTSTPLNLRHLPTSFGCTAYHPQRRTVLIAACGSQLVVFDSEKPNTPVKIVSLGSNIVDFTFLPNGKGLLAAATEDGDSYIVDVEKEKLLVGYYRFDPPDRLLQKHQKSRVQAQVDSTLSQYR